MTAFRQLLVAGFAFEREKANLAKLLQSFARHVQESTAPLSLQLSAGEASLPGWGYGGRNQTG